MTGNEVREKYLKFFEKRGHKIISPAPLVLKDDPTTLFTSAGMQPLVPNLLGEKHPDGNKLVDSQPCFRSQDIEEVGDNRHDTLFEMLGNWGLGSYFKKEQIPWLWEFLTRELELPKEKLYITVFEGNAEIDKDNEVYKIWKSLGVDDEHIYFYGDKKNWWSRAGAPANMPVGEPGGSSSEVFFDFGAKLKIHEHSPFKDEKCHVNCDCGRYVEIANSVFVQYKKESDGSLSELRQKNVDFGGGLERILMAVNNQPDMFKNDLHYPIIKEIEKASGERYEGNELPMQVIADHLKAACFLVADGVVPSNKLQGYVLRRLLRRAATKAFMMNRDYGCSQDFRSLVKTVINIYHEVYFQGVDVGKIEDVIVSEILKFRKTLESGVKLLSKHTGGRLDIKMTFDFYQNYGFPYEVLKEEAEKLGIRIASKMDFDNEFKKHQELSRKSSTEKFKIK